MSCEIYRTPATEVCVPGAWQSTVPTVWAEELGGIDIYLDAPNTFRFTNQRMCRHCRIRAATASSGKKEEEVCRGAGGTLADQLSVRLMLILFYN